ncbi:major facilitator superfamily domain-containing protein [Aspergillus pseudodeflectus]|uniref:Major facilitator superfamily domain-containing protein n=1 Tax=Aspergillus pseudodeflectus TaxID=176178 RepID=A0ABR4JWI6_9EURO
MSKLKSGLALALELTDPLAAEVFLAFHFSNCNIHLPPSLPQPLADREMVASEESPLLPSPPDTEANEPEERSTKRSGLLIVYCGFLGVLIASADESIMISTYTAIASQFHALSHGSWLVMAYNFGYCISLPVCSVLGDVYGRKKVLLGSYLLFGLSCLACGACTSIPQLVLARVLSGSSGAGIIVMVSIILADFLPSQDVALYRGYQNAVNVAGRSFGAPIGGLFIDTIGWRWSFYGQVPILALCAVFTAYRLPSSVNDATLEDDPLEAVPSRRSPLRDLDYVGIISFSGALLALLFLLRAIGARDDSMAVQVSLLSVAFAVGAVVFVATELFWARKPLIPLRQISSGLAGYFVIQVLLLGGRWPLVTNLTPYLIRVIRASDFVASTAYVVVALGISVGGIISGLIIKHTHCTKLLTLLTTTSLILVYTLITLQFPHGFQPWYVIHLVLIGIGSGILFPALFVGVASIAPEGMLSVTIGTYYLCQQLGLILGPAVGSAVETRGFEDRLWRDLNEAIHHILNEVRYAETLPAHMQKIVRACYLESFTSLPLIAVGATAAMLPIMALLREPDIV